MRSEPEAVAYLVDRNTNELKGIRRICREDPVKAVVERERRRATNPDHAAVLCKNIVSAWLQVNTSQGIRQCLRVPSTRYGNPGPVAVIAVASADADDPAEFVTGQRGERGLNLDLDRAL